MSDFQNKTVNTTEFKQIDYIDRLDIPQDIFISPMCPDYKSYFGNVPGLLVKIIDYKLPMCQIIHWKCARLMSKD